MANALRARWRSEWPIEIAEAATVREYLALAADADLVIASRLHAVILGLVAGTPVIAVSYSRKVKQLMHELDMDNECIELSGMAADQLFERARAAIANAAELRRRIRSQNIQMRSALDDDYRAVLGLLGARTSAVHDSVTTAG
jgi:polysaccharide pyruvyl transferase WcaK-like protein